MGKSRGKIFMFAALFLLAGPDAGFSREAASFEDALTAARRDYRASEYLDVPGVVPAAMKGVFFEENPDFKMDWGRLAEIEKSVRIKRYPDGSPEVIPVIGYHEVRVGKRTFGIGVAGQTSIEEVRLYPGGAAKALFFPRPMTAVTIGGKPYMFLNRLCRDMGREYDGRSHEYREKINCGRLGIGFHENGEIQAGIVVVMKDGRPRGVFKAGFDSEGRLVEEIDVERIPDLGKPLLSLDFYKDYEQALRDRREKNVTEK